MQKIVSIKIFCGRVFDNGRLIINIKPLTAYAVITLIDVHSRPENRLMKIQRKIKILRSMRVPRALTELYVIHPSVVIASERCKPLKRDIWRVSVSSLKPLLEKIRSYCLESKNFHLRE